jgi:hypothetical protein
MKLIFDGLYSLVDPGSLFDEVLKYYENSVDLTIKKKVTLAA